VSSSLCCYQNRFRQNPAEDLKVEKEGEGLEDEERVGDEEDLMEELGEVDSMEASVEEPESPFPYPRHPATRPVKDAERID